MVVIKRRYNGMWRILGSGSSSTVPLAPTGVQVDVSIAEQATISWMAPADTGGSPITGYMVSYARMSDGLADSKSVGAGVLSTSIVDLAAGDTYIFTVHAANVNGVSEESAAVQALITVAGGFVLPTLATVGPRNAPNRTLTAAQALAELRSTNYLSRTIVTGTFGLDGSDGVNWVIEDCRFEGGSTYGVRGYTGTAFTGTQAQRPVFRYCEILGRAAYGNGDSDTGACVYAADIIIEHSNIYGGVDGIKARHRLDMRHSWVHDLDHPAGAHCDAVQIVSGINSVFIGNRFDAYVGYSSDGSLTPTGDTGNGVLQTGSVTGPISALWEYNWFAGGHYTIRGAGSDPQVEYIFRNNRFLRFGTSVALGLANLPPSRYGSNYGGVTTNEVWENNVWDDTEEVVV